MSDNRARAEREVERELEGNRDLWEYAVSLKEREIEGEQTGECVHPYRRVLIDWRDQTTECTLCGKKLL